MIPEIQKIFGGNLLCVAEYGVGDVQYVIIVDKIDTATLNTSKKALQNHFKKIKKFPLILTKEELNDGLDVFPLEFLNMKLNHKILFGNDIFDKLKFDKKNVRRELEYEFRSKLINLRQSYLIIKSDKELGVIVNSSIPTLLPMLNGMLFLRDIKVPSDINEILELTGKEYGINISALKRLKEFGHSNREESVKELVDLLGRLGEMFDEMKL